jgi:hypothetical protein
VRPLLTVAALAVALAGCGAAPQIPTACLAGPAAIRTALEAAPGPVTLDGTPISACLDQSGDPAAAQGVGTSLVDVASGLADAVADKHDSASATQLGYLIGAVRKGAGETPTLNAELLRRLELEAGRIDTDSPSYKRGEKAGETSG